LVFASGAGAASRNSVGMTVMGGMLAVAFVGTFLVPAFFVMIEEMKVYTAHKFGKKKDVNKNV
jgi:multidrug efflux pump subunit AcrB